MSHASCSIVLTLSNRKSFYLSDLGKKMSFFFLSFLGWGETSPLGTSATNSPTVPAPDDDCGAVGGMRTGRGHRNTRRKPASVPLGPPQIPHDLTWARSRRQTFSAMARPKKGLSNKGNCPSDPKLNDMKRCSCKYCEFSELV
jgi:hypothetical protein